MKSFNKKTIARLLTYLTRHKALLVAAIALTVLSNVLALVGPMLTGYAIDAIEPGEGAVVMEKVIFFCVLMLLCYGASALMTYFMNVVVIDLTQKVVFRMRKEVFDKLLDLPVSYFDTRQAGDLISRISYDIDTVNSSLSTDVIQVCTTVITVIGAFCSMMYLAPSMLVVFLITLPITFIFTSSRVKYIKPLFRTRSKKLGELNGLAEELISGQKTIKAYGREEVMLGRFADKNTESVDAYYKAEYYGSMIGPCVNFINNLSLTLISTFGALLYLFGRISLGSVSSFILYSRKFSGPINELANIISEIQSALAAAERVFAVIDEEPEKADCADAVEMSRVEGAVDIRDLSFGYDSSREILHNMNVSVKPGQLVAIVGHTGAGKTTLINLLMRFYDPTSGSIELDGVDISKLTRKSLRLCYTMVLQDTWLFGGSIFDNIAYGRTDATIEQVMDAARAAGIHDYISGLPQGYYSQISDDGVNLSKGQKQLITIARAMMSRSEILILDEATSNVDTRTERQIQDAMYALMKGRTCFVIAHRLSTIENADLILVMDQGRIVEQGNHRQLLDIGGVYANMYRSQFEQ